jgi:hypothetical protein
LSEAVLGFADSTKTFCNGLEVEIFLIKIGALSKERTLMHLGQ